MANRTGGIGCLGAIGVLIAAGVVARWANEPWFWLAVAGVVVALLAVTLAFRAQRLRQLKADLLTQAQWLERKSTAVLDPANEAAVMLAEGEHQLFALAQVGLTEWKSTGATFSGGTLGASFRVSSGVNIGLGGSAGRLLNNPETKQVTDTGTATFTTERIVFVGNQRTVEWDLEKLVGVDSGPNGMSVQFAVTNLPTNSGLLCTNQSQVTPGIALDITVEYRKNGQAAAAAKCSDYAAKLRSASQGKAH